MSHANISVDLERDDLPETWEAALYVIEQKYPAYKHGDIRFWELPSHHYGSFEEPESATCIVTKGVVAGHQVSIKVTCEQADISAEEGEGSYEGYLVGVTEPWLGEGRERTVEHYALLPEFTKPSNRLSGFHFVDLKRVEHPKIEAKTK
jgi:hypothetical protein